MTTISNDATVDIVLEISACQRMQFQEQLGHDQQLTKATTKLFRNPWTTIQLHIAGGEAHLWGAAAAVVQVERQSKEVKTLLLTGFFFFSFFFIRQKKNWLQLAMFSQKLTI